MIRFPIDRIDKTLLVKLTCKGLSTSRIRISLYCSPWNTRYKCDKASLLNYRCIYFFIFYFFIFASWIDWSLITQESNSPLGIELTSFWFWTATLKHEATRIQYLPSCWVFRFIAVLISNISMTNVNEKTVNYFRLLNTISVLWFPTLSIKDSICLPLIGLKFIDLSDSLVLNISIPKDKRQIRPQQNLNTEHSDEHGTPNHFILAANDSASSQPLSSVDIKEFGYILSTVLFFLFKVLKHPSVLHQYSSHNTS